MKTLFQLSHYSLQVHFRLDSVIGLSKALSVFWLWDLFHYLIKVCNEVEPCLTSVVAEEEFSPCWIWLYWSWYVLWIDLNISNGIPVRAMMLHICSLGTPPKPSSKSRKQTCCGKVYSQDFPLINRSTDIWSTVPLSARSVTTLVLIQGVFNQASQVLLQNSSIQFSDMAHERDAPVVLTFHWAAVMFVSCADL